jgi:SAM-dependent methyltransferase
MECRRLAGMNEPTPHQTLETIRDDFDRIALLPDEPWNHNLHYRRVLLRRVPRSCAEALDVGCGAGALTRELATRCGHVTGLDLSPNMVAEARRRSAGVANVDYAVADVMTEPLPAGAFDCITAVALLHHLPLEPALSRFRDLLRPGGVLLVLDVRPGEFLPVDLLALGASTLLCLWHTGRPRESQEARQAWAEHGRTDRYPPRAEVRAACERVLPGAAVRRHLIWRYSLVWRKP